MSQVAIIDSVDRALLEQFTSDQTSRYEFYRRSSLQRATIKKVRLIIFSIVINVQVMHTVSGSTINQKMAIVMGGIAKIFVGEIIETG
jgi:transcription initiation factor TFIID subunit 11